MKLNTTKRCQYHCTEKNELFGQPSILYLKNQKKNFSWNFQPLQFSPWLSWNSNMIYKIHNPEMVMYSGQLLELIGYLYCCIKMSCFTLGDYQSICINLFVIEKLKQCTISFRKQLAQLSKFLTFSAVWSRRSQGVEGSSRETVLK